MDFVHPIESVFPGAQAKILSILANTTGSLNLRTIARLSDVSEAQVSRVIPRLVELGLVNRWETPPSSQFQLNRQHVAVEALMPLARASVEVTRSMETIAKKLPVTPVSVILFGSFAMGEADSVSDIDCLLVRPDGTDFERWDWTINSWKNEVGQLTGNPVEVLEVGEDEIGNLLRSKRPVWEAIDRHGLVVYGLGMHQLRTLALA